MRFFALLGLMCTCAMPLPWDAIDAIAGTFDDIVDDVAVERLHRRLRSAPLKSHKQAPPLRARVRLHVVWASHLCVGSTPAYTFKA